MSVHCGTDVSFTNEEHISVYKSCDWAELGFCKNCGSHLFYRSSDNGEYILQAGTFASDDDFELNQQIFIDERYGSNHGYNEGGDGNEPRNPP